MHKSYKSLFKKDLACPCSSNKISINSSCQKSLVFFKGEREMEHHRSISDITQPGSVYRVFKYPREHPKLPPGYNWKTQKNKYCPRDLWLRTNRLRSKTKFGYVFCHRGLYERSSGIVDNSHSAIENGLNLGFYLHEIDAFIWGKMDDAFLAHDQVAGRVTSEKEKWASYSLDEILKTNLVVRGVNLENPDFTSSYLKTPYKVPGLESVLWKEMFKPTGRTLQIDLRGEEFAKGIAHWSFHISNGPHQSKVSRGLLQSTILKGHNLHFKSFDHLVQKIKDESTKAYGCNYFELEHLHQLSPLIMVFYSHPLIDLARESPPKDPSTTSLSYEHIRDVFMEHVSSFTGIGHHRYNFILEITHSGLGLHYNVKTGKARNPLTGEPLTDQDVIFDSLVDRAMIDVSLELRRKRPELLFSSCTRLPDVITSVQKYKADHKSGKLVAWQDGEKGIAARLRSIHGGLYPQSDLVVADDPMAEIAARTWIDEKASLDRRELLSRPYYEWLAMAGKDVLDAVNNLNGEFLPNMIGGSVDVTSSTVLGTDAREPGSPIDGGEAIRLWLAGVRSPLLGDMSGPTMANELDRNEESQDKNSEDEIYEESSVRTNDPEQAVYASGVKVSEDLAKLLSSCDIFGSDSKQKSAVLHLPGGIKWEMFASLADRQHAVVNMAAYNAAAQNNEEALKKLLSAGADINAAIGFFGNALVAACARDHYNIVKLLIDNEADIHVVTDLFGNALAVACQCGHYNIVKLLIDNGADINALGHPFSLPLALASQGGHYTVAELLLDEGADVNASTESSGTALRVACERGHISTAKLLLEKGADINASTKSSDTALAAACAYGHISTIELLLREGADVNVPFKRIYSSQIQLMLMDAGAAHINGVPILPTGARHIQLPKRATRRLKMKASWHDRARKTRFDPIPMIRSCGCFLCDMEKTSYMLETMLLQKQKIGNKPKANISMGCKKPRNQDTY
ncbi:ankyrin, partial [Xylaria digitata]